MEVGFALVNLLFSATTWNMYVHEFDSFGFPIDFVIKQTRGRTPIPPCYWLGGWRQVETRGRRLLRRGGGVLKGLKRGGGGLFVGDNHVGLD